MPVPEDVDRLRDKTGSRRERTRHRRPPGAMEFPVARRGVRCSHPRDLQPVRLAVLFGDRTENPGQGTIGAVEGGAAGRERMVAMSLLPAEAVSGRCLELLGGTIRFSHHS